MKQALGRREVPTEAYLLAIRTPQGLSGISSSHSRAPPPSTMLRGVVLGVQASFLAVGLLLWLSAVGSAGGGERRAAIGVIGMLLTSMHMALLGALLNLAPRPLYHHQGEAALAGQQLGGLLMLVIGGTVYLVAGLWLLAGLLQEPRQRCCEHPAQPQVLASMEQLGEALYTSAGMLWKALWAAGWFLGSQ